MIAKEEGSLFSYVNLRADTHMTSILRRGGWGVRQK